MYRYEFAGIIMHAEHLEAIYRSRPAYDQCAASLHAPMISIRTCLITAISDDIFAKIVACIRIAVPYTGMIVSTRESAEST